MKIEARPWKPQDLLDDLQEIIDEEPDSYMNTRRATLCMSLDYLKEHFAERSNTPLTLDELREMDGEPVWVERIGDVSHIDSAWALVNRAHCLCRTSDGISAFFELYGKFWMAYRRKPEEVAE